MQTFTLGDAYTITPNVVNAAHISILRRVDNRGYAPNDINAATLGVNVYQVVPNGLQMTEGKFTIGGGTNSVAHFNDNTGSIDDDVDLGARQTPDCVRRRMGAEPAQHRQCV